MVQRSPARRGSKPLRKASALGLDQPGPWNRASMSMKGAEMRVASARGRVVFPLPLAEPTTAMRRKGLPEVDSCAASWCQVVSGASDRHGR